MQRSAPPADARVVILRLAQVFSVVGVLYVALVTPGSMYHRSALPPPWPLQRRIAEATAGWYAAAPQLLAVDAVPTGPPLGPVADYATFELTFTFLTAANATLLLSQEDTAPSYTVGNVRTYRVTGGPSPATVAAMQPRLAQVHIGPADAYQGARLLASAFATAHPGVEKPLITLLADPATLTDRGVDPAQVPVAWEVYFSSPGGAHLTVIIDAATGTFVRAHGGE